MKKNAWTAPALCLALCAAFALASCTNEVGATLGSETAVGESYKFPETTKIAGKINSQVFNQQGQSIGSVDTWFLEGYEKVPFLRFSDVAFIISKTNGSGWKLNAEGSRDSRRYIDYAYRKYDPPYTSDALVFDPTNQTISSDEFVRILSYAINIANGIGYCYYYTDEKASTAKPAITLNNQANPTTQVQPKEKTEIKLGDYGMKMFVLDTTGYNSASFEGFQNDLFVPFQVVSTAFFFFHSATFNGSDYYLWLNTDLYNDNTAFRGYDSGRAGGAATRSQFMSEWNYRNLCLFYDLNYSLKSKRSLVGKDNIGDRISDSIFARGLGFDLLSTDTVTYDNALVKFLLGYIDDVHTSYIEPSLYQPMSAVASYKELARKSSGSRCAKVDSILFGDLPKRREAAGGGEGVFYVEEGGQKKMAVIAFNNFLDSDPGNGPWTLPSLAATNTYQFFKQAFIDIAKYPSVKNVALDLSCNGGGSCESCFLALCFLEDPDKFYMGQWNFLDNSMTKFTASIYDGNAQSLTPISLKKDYNFYVLTSGGSFSCGNFFPSVCKWQFNKSDPANPRVPIVGKQSGGGAANVKNAQTADGALFRTSCATQMCEFDANGNYICIDAGVPVDFEIDYEKFYSGSVIYGDLYGLLKEKYSDRF